MFIAPQELNIGAAERQFREEHSPISDARQRTISDTVIGGSVEGNLLPGKCPGKFPSQKTSLRTRLRVPDSSL